MGTGVGATVGVEKNGEGTCALVGEGKRPVLPQGDKDGGAVCSGGRRYGAVSLGAG